MIQIPNLSFSSCLRKFDTPKMRKLCICMTLPCIRTKFFPELPAEFLHQDIHRKVLNLEEVRNVKLSPLLLPEETWLPEKSKTCICVWFFLRFWTSSTKVSANNFNSVQGYSINLFRKIFPAFVVLIGWNWQNCDFYFFYSQTHFL